MQQPHSPVPMMATRTFVPVRPVKRTWGLWIGFLAAGVVFVLLIGVGLFVYISRNPELVTRLNPRPASSAGAPPMVSASAGLTPRTFDRNPFEDSPP